MSSRSLLVVVSLLSSVAAERYLRVADGARSADPTRKELYLGPDGNIPPSKSPSAGQSFIFFVASSCCSLSCSSGSLFVV